jgi:ATP-dependent RNA helicase MSS116
MKLPVKIHANTLKALKDVFKFKEFTNTQSLALPKFLEFTANKDLFLQAHTGSGKSLVYLTAQVEMLVKAVAAAGNPVVDTSMRRRSSVDVYSLDRPAKAGSILSVILVPNRELGEQVYEVAQRLLTFHEVKAVGLLGGQRSRTQDVQALERVKPEILIATPGRLTHHVEASTGFAEQLATTRSLVIDEADFLMTQGIDNQLEKIFDCMPKNKRTTLISATITDEVKRLSERIFRPNFELIKVENNQDDIVPAKLDQTVLVCDQILPALYDLLLNQGSNKIVCFYPTAQTADFTFRIFKEKLKFPIRLLHGQLTVSERIKELKRFANEQRSILFTTDLTARGIDFQNVSLIVQVHVPVSTEQYVHRIGRTARAGDSGRAVLLISKEEKQFVNHLQSKRLLFAESSFNASSCQSFSSFTRFTQSWACSDPELIAAAEDTRRSLVGYFESGPARLNKIQNSRNIAKRFIASAGYSI